MDPQVSTIIELIQKSPLDQTIKDILVRDLQTEGLTEFLREQIMAYCLEGLKTDDPRIKRAILTLKGQPNADQPA